MISLIDDKEKILSLGRADVFGTRIASEFLSKTAELIWWDHKKLLMSLKNGVLSISGEVSDPEELKEFIALISPAVIMCMQEKAELLDLGVIQSGVLMRKEGNGDLSPVLGYFPDILFSDYHELLEKCDMAPDYSGFCRETSIALRTGTGILLDEREGDKLTAALIATSVTDDSAIINAVAVDPDHQRKGLGKALMERADKQLSGRKLFIMREDSKNEEFYVSCGYKNCGRWSVAENNI